MTNVLYPLGLIEQLKVTPSTRVLSDVFEDGSTNTRLLYPAQNFKRHFMVQHAPLTLDEYRYLRSFHSQRSGLYDAFWFRDNVNRAGNARVRFAKPLPEEHNGILFNTQTEMDEVAAIRALPEWDEITSAAGGAPVLWLDANQEFYLNHAGMVYTEAAAYDAAFHRYPAAWQAGSALNLGGAVNQYQTYNFSGAECAKTAGNVAELSGAQPACTLFAIVRQTATTAKQVLFAVGTKATGSALGLVLSAANNYEPWLGGAETWTLASKANSPADAYRSIAVVWAASSNTATLYANAASVGSDTNTRSLATGPLSLGAAPDGSLICNPSNGMANQNLAHVLVFATALTLVQIKALHNLLGYQYGLATVA
jgi:hypothetical protein